MYVVVPSMQSQKMQKMRKAECQRVLEMKFMGLISNRMLCLDYCIGLSVHLIEDLGPWECRTADM